MTIVIDKETVRTVLPEAVREKGEDYVYNAHYESCSYVVGDHPACLVGVFLAKLGVSIEALRDLDNTIWPDASTSSVDSEGWWMFCKANDIQITQAANQALFEAQRKQDGGVAWGTALALGLMQLDKAEDVPVDAEAEIERFLAYLHEDDE